MYGRPPLTPNPLQHDTNTAQAARGAWAVVKAGDSSLKDRLEAAKVLLFLTFEDPTSRFVGVGGFGWGWGRQSGGSTGLVLILLSPLTRHTTYLSIFLSIYLSIYPPTPQQGGLVHILRADDGHPRQLRGLHRRLPPP